MLSINENKSKMDLRLFKTKGVNCENFERKRLNKGIIFFLKFETMAWLKKKKERTEAVAQRCSMKKVFLEILENSKESTCARVPFFNIVAGQRPATLSKKRLWHRCFLVYFVKFLRTPFITEHLRSAKKESFLN